MRKPHQPRTAAFAGGMPTSFVHEVDPQPTDKPSEALIRAMKRCISPDVRAPAVKLQTKIAQVIVKADLPWFSGVSAADVLSAVSADATCFTPAQLAELRRFEHWPPPSVTVLLSRLGAKGRRRHR